MYTSDEPELEFSGSSRAEPWRFRAEPSRAELGHFNFRAESEPNQKVPGLKESKSPGNFLSSGDFPAPLFTPFFLSDFLLATKDIIFNHVHSEFRAISPICKKRRVERKSLVFCPFSSLNREIPELEGIGHEPSRAELKIVQLEPWLEPARLGLITTDKPCPQLQPSLLQMVSCFPKKIKCHAWVKKCQFAFFHQLRRPRSNVDTICYS